MQSFHNLILSYSPKRIGYKHGAYVARVQLAYLDHNHHLGRPQLVAKNGKPVFTKKWGKRTSRWHVVPIPAAKTYSYIPRKFYYYRNSTEIILMFMFVSYDGM